MSAPMRERNERWRRLDVVFGWVYLACAVATTLLAVADPRLFYIIQPPIMIALAWVRFSRARWRRRPDVGAGKAIGVLVSPEGTETQGGPAEPFVVGWDESTVRKFELVGGIPVLLDEGGAKTWAEAWDAAAKSKKGRP